MRFQFGLKTGLSLIVAVSLSLAMVRYLIKRQNDQYFESCLSAVQDMGFSVSAKDGKLALGVESTPLPVIGGREAVEIAAVAQRYTITIEDCRITRQGLEILKMAEGFSKDVILAEYKLVSNRNVQPWVLPR